MGAGLTAEASQRALAPASCEGCRLLQCLGFRVFSAFIGLSALRGLKPGIRQVGIWVGEMIWSLGN